MDLQKIIKKIKSYHHINNDKYCFNYYYYDCYNNEYVIQIYKEKERINIIYEDECINLNPIYINKIKEELNLNVKKQRINKKDYTINYRNTKNNNLLNKYYQDIINQKHEYW